jgi:hypothetical protein
MLPGPYNDFAPRRRLGQEFNVASALHNHLHEGFPKTPSANHTEEARYSAQTAVLEPWFFVNAIKDSCGAAPPHNPP